MAKRKAADAPAPPAVPAAINTVVSIEPIFNYSLRFTCSDGTVFEASVQRRIGPDHAQTGHARDELREALLASLAHYPGAH
jgi:hypothetical protein